MSRHNVTIKIDRVGGFTYEISPLSNRNQQQQVNAHFQGRRFWAHRNDRIKWMCQTTEGAGFNIRMLVIHFDENRPFGVEQDGENTYRFKSRLDDPVIEVKVKADALFIPYKYFVAAMTSDEDLWTDDPDFIIDP